MSVPSRFSEAGRLAKADHAATRAVGLDMRVAVGGELFDGGVKGVHLFEQVLENYAPHREYQDDYD